jgi:hypothetical protein
LKLFKPSCIDGLGKAVFLNAVWRGNIFSGKDGAMAPVLQCRPQNPNPATLQRWKRYSLKSKAVGKTVYAFLQSCHGFNTAPLILPLIIPENDVNQRHMQFAESLGVLSADPAAILFHAFHVLSKFDTYQFGNHPVCLILEEIFDIGRRATEDGPVLLSENVGARKAAKEEKALRIFSRGGVESVHSDKSCVVSGGEIEDFV